MPDNKAMVLILDAAMVYDRTRIISAPPADVWPWIVHLAKAAVAGIKPLSGNAYYHLGGRRPASSSPAGRIGQLATGYGESITTSVYRRLTDRML